MRVAAGSGRRDPNPARIVRHDSTRNAKRNIANMTDARANNPQLIARTRTPTWSHFASTGRSIHAKMATVIANPSNRRSHVPYCFQMLDTSGRLYPSSQSKISLTTAPTLVIYKLNHERTGRQLRFLVLRIY